jgi:nicotinamide-nucleotide amidase
MASRPESIPAAVIAALVVAEQRLATAESLTGGLIGATLTAVPGASKAYLGGLITYATELKAKLGGVPAAVLAEHGPVSPVTASAMALGVQSATGADWAVAVTGVAGPDPQDGHAPGEVWVGLANPQSDATTHRLDLAGSREEIRRQTVTAALWLVLDAIHADVS